MIVDDQAVVGRVLMVHTIEKGNREKVRLEDRMLAVMSVGAVVCYFVRSSLAVIADLGMK